MKIDESVEMGRNFEVGNYVVIEKDVIIGNDVSIGHHVVIQKGTIIGNNVHINDGSILGRSPSASKKMARKPTSKLSPLIIGDDINIGCNCVIYRGTKIADGVLVADLASIREHVSIGQNTIIGRVATVENNTSIGENVTVQTNSYVTADMIIEDNVFIGPCFVSSNDKYMGRGNYDHKGPILKKDAKIGANATLLPGITIGESAVVGAGAVITKDISKSKVVVGNPARELNR